MVQKDKAKKKILIASDNFLPRWDGIAIFLVELIPRLSEKYDITLIVPDFGKLKPIDNFDSVKIIRVPTRKIKVGDFPIPNPKDDLILPELKKADLVFCQTIGPVGLRVIDLANKNNKKVVSYIHSIEWELITRAIGFSFFKQTSFSIAKSFVRNTYKKVNLLILPSQGVSELFTWHQIETPKEVVHLGVDTERFVAAKDKEKAKENIGLAKDALVIGFHGRIGREKDLLTLLRAFILIKKKYPSAILLIVGDGVESIKKKLSNVAGVVLPGSTSNVVPYLQAMDVYCLTSLTETTSLSTLEAMSCEVPVVVNKVGFVKDYVKEKKNGLFFVAKDSYDLSKQIQLLIKDEDLREKLSKAARKLVEKEFDWNETAKKLIIIFEKFLDEKKKL